MHPSHLAQLADDHRRDLLATAERVRLARTGPPPPMRWWRSRRRARAGAPPVVIVLHVAPVALAPVPAWRPPLRAVAHGDRRPCSTRRR